MLGMLGASDLRLRKTLVYCWIGLCFGGLGVAAWSQSPDRELVLTGFLSDYESLVLSRRDNWLMHSEGRDRPLASYDALLLDPIAAYPSLQATPSEIRPATLRPALDFLRDLLHERIDRLTRFRLSSEPGPRVAKIRLAVTNLRAATDREKGPALELYKAFDVPSESDPLALQHLVIEVEVVDSLSGERLVAVVDGRAGERLADWASKETDLTQSTRLDGLTKHVVKKLAGQEMLR